jgi:DNA polymerase-3 subunit delta
MPQTTEAVLKDLEAKKFSPIYFLHGEEPFFIDEITNYIEDNALPAAEKGFNQTVLYGKEVSMMNVLENARRFPMMAQFQVVIVKEAQEMSDLGKKDAQEKLDAGSSLVQVYTGFIYEGPAIARNIANHIN